MRPSFTRSHLPRAASIGAEGPAVGLEAGRGAGLTCCSTPGPHPQPPPPAGLSLATPTPDFSLGSVPLPLSLTSLDRG